MIFDPSSRPAQKLPALREFERITVTRVQVAEGEGVVGDPVRPVTYWYEDDGRLILREDTYRFVDAEDDHPRGGDPYRWCVVCCKGYEETPPAEIHVYPDGCTAHYGCTLTQEGQERAAQHGGHGEGGPL